LVLRLGTILPGIPPPSAFEQSQNMTEATDIDLSGVPPSVFGAVGIAIGGIIGRYRCCVVYSSLWLAKGYGMGLDSN